MSTEKQGGASPQPIEGVSVGQALQYIYPHSIGDRVYWVNEKGDCFPVILVDVRVLEDFNINAIVKAVGQMKCVPEPLRIAGVKMMPRRMFKNLDAARKGAPAVKQFFKEYRDEQQARQADVQRQGG